MAELQEAAGQDTEPGLGVPGMWEQAAGSGGQNSCPTSSEGAAPRAVPWRCFDVCWGWLCGTGGPAARWGGAGWRAEGGGRGQKRAHLSGCQEHLWGPLGVRGFVVKLQHSVSNFCWHFTPNLPANRSKHGPNLLMSYGQDGAREREIHSTNHP